ncbi:DNA gyrase inhibitor YacG [Tatumella saanichensis]|uniref:DNA gyrase inhibitor YacG n=1 Tax=Tatumella saanichensis TaxID=480813 RepID=UPI0004A2FFA1|nr:DNA gyrase inhibitor YacG [Tatumella saanichensis]
MQEEIITVKCPQCQKEVIWDELSPWRPFCSKRCQMIDLGEWAAEENRIPLDDKLSEDENWSGE